eukprot:scaffold25895_cov108-Cylindrotheca_fusiformis.AAC.1
MSKASRSSPAARSLLCTFHTSMLSWPRNDNTENRLKFVVWLTQFMAPTRALVLVSLRETQLASPSRFPKGGSYVRCRYLNEIFEMRNHSVGLESLHRGPGNWGLNLSLLNQVGTITSLIYQNLTKEKIPVGIDDVVPEPNVGTRMLGAKRSYVEVARRSLGLEENEPHSLQY